MDPDHFSSRRAAPSRDARGFTMVATLLVVVIMGVAAAIVITQQSPSTPKRSTMPSTPGSSTSVPHSASSGANLAARAACQADFVALTSALNQYRVLNATLPGPGTSWATASALGGPFLATWPDQPHYFSITWNGKVLSVVPSTGTPSHGNTGTSSPKTGCFSV